MSALSKARIGITLDDGKALANNNQAISTILGGIGSSAPPEDDKPGVPTQKQILEKWNYGRKI